MLKELAKDRKMDEPSLKLLEAQMMMVGEDFAGARKALADANKLKPNDLLIHRALVQLTRVDPEAGPEKALKMWDSVAIQFKDQEQALADLRLDKADILMALKKDDLRGELASLFAGIENWPVQEKVELWGGMSQKYLSLGMMDEARQYLSLAADNRPNELPLRMSLFMLALDANDDAGMKQAQEKILEIVKDRNDSNFLYTEARRKLSQLRRGEVGKEVTNEIRQLINRAQEQRPDWHEPYVISAELELQDGNYAQALRQFDEAARRGRLYPRAVAQHIELLYRFGRFAEAGRQMERLSEPLRQSLLGPLYPEILFLTEQRHTALKEARAATEREPENPQNYYWYSQLLSRSARVPGVSDEQRKKAINDAISAMRRVVELQPEYPDAWYGLITYHLMLRDAVQAQKTLREAQLALNGDNLQLFLAKSYEALLRWFDAETMYRAVYEAKPDELARAQQLAAFYLGPVYPLPDKQQKAAPLINQMLRTAPKAKSPPAIHTCNGREESERGCWPPRAITRTLSRPRICSLPTCKRVSSRLKIRWKWLESCRRGRNPGLACGRCSCWRKSASRRPKPWASRKKSFSARCISRWANGANTPARWIWLRTDIQNRPLPARRTREGCSNEAIRSQFPRRPRISLSFGNWRPTTPRRSSSRCAWPTNLAGNLRPVPSFCECCQISQPSRSSRGNSWKCC